MIPDTMRVSVLLAPGGGLLDFSPSPGGPCAVRRREIEPSEVEGEVQGAGVFREARHEVWWEDSSVCLPDTVDPRGPKGK
jgi:hypothetical protein